MFLLKRFISILVCMVTIFSISIVNIYADFNLNRNSERYHIIINTQTNKLGYFKDKKFVREFDIASGKTNTETPTGKTTIVNKIKNRPYYTGNIPGGDPRNPLGDRWLGLNLKGTYGTTYAIHGNNNPSSIGKHVSGGCVRMHNDEVRWLYDQVPVGTTVIIQKSSKTFAEIASAYNINLDDSNNFKSLTKDIYKYDAGKGNYLTYINGRGYSQYSYLNTSGKYAFTPSSWMKAAGLDVTMPTSSNGYTMSISNPYIDKVNELKNILSKVQNGEIETSTIGSILQNFSKVSIGNGKVETNKPYKKTLTKDIYRYNVGEDNYLTYIEGKGYSQFSYLNTSGKYAFTPSSWMKAAGLDVTMPTKSNGYTMVINNTYMIEYNELIDKINSYI